MRKTLEELFYGNLTPNEQQITPDSPLQQAMDQAEEYEEKLSALLEGEEKTMLLRLLNAENEIGSTLALENFILGFRLGMCLAVEAMGRAYVPYSGYQVGAALLCAHGTVYQGCNIENASYTPTICAERNAFFKAVYDGKREFSAIAVVGGKNGVISGIFPPCGVCRQVMREFCRDDFCIYMGGAGGAYETYTLAELLPCSFSAAEHMK